MDTKIRSDGLRYESKEGGSLFAGLGLNRSCFKCGEHRASDQLRAQRLLGRTELVCKPSCGALARPPR